MKNKRMIINLASNIISLIVNVGISFFLTRYIVMQIGKEANGFINLANNFVNYATIVTVALNSVAGRFITIKIHQKDEEGANVYFNSVLVGNAIMSIILSLISVFIIVFLEKIIKIPIELVLDVKLTFAIVFITFILTLMTSIFNVATYVRNRLDLSSLRDIEGNFIKVISLLLLFYILEPKIFYVSVSVLFMRIFNSVKNYKYVKVLLPEVKFNIKKAKFTAIKEMISLGIWNSVNNLSNVLLSGLDLLIANIFIGATEMGTMAIAKSIPNIFTTFLSTIAAVYSPRFTILFAEGKREELVHEIKLSMKTLGLIAAVPLIGFAVFGTEFYSLWLPTESFDTIKQIQILSLLEIGPRFISMYVFTLYAINMITNKLKTPVIVTLVLSVISTGLVLILLNTTNWGVYAISGVSAVLLILRVIFFVPTYAAHSLKEKLNVFYKPMIKGMFSSLVLIVVFMLIRKFTTINSWLDLGLVAVFAGIVGYIINAFIILNKAERKIIFKKIKNKIVRR